MILSNELAHVERVEPLPKKKREFVCFIDKNEEMNGLKKKILETFFIAIKTIFNNFTSRFKLGRFYKLVKIGYQPWTSKFYNTCIKNSLPSFCIAETLCLLQNWHWKTFFLKIYIVFLLFSICNFKTAWIYFLHSTCISFLLFLKNSLI